MIMTDPFKEIFSADLAVQKKEDPEKPYAQILKPYIFQPEDFRYEELYLAEYGFNPNVGWKLHLNVKPENIIAVSNYLKNINIPHKMLSGGEVEVGKIFTICTGSRIYTLEVIKMIEKDILPLLEEPHQDIGEPLLGNKIVGRFVGDRRNFQQYGPNGISRLEGDLGPQYLVFQHTNLDAAIDLAWKLYGEYFGGLITPIE